MTNELPAISVIVPMYNTEKYVAVCLESILAQSFTNFEVIVVDDCSTDKSVEIAESYAPKFGGRLKLLHTEKNSGCCGVPRNEGMKIARGKYVYFCDSDDFLLENALENLYNTAERFQADILICKRFLASTGTGKKFLQSVELQGDEGDNSFEQMTDNLEMRAKYWLQVAGHSSMGVWLKFTRRDFLLENKIIFLPVMQEDSIWTFELLCLAKKILLVPQICYLYRVHPNSLFRKADSVELTPNLIYKKFDRIINGLKHVDELMGRIEFFRQNPLFRYAVIDIMVNQNLNWIYNKSDDVLPFEVYENFKVAFKNELGDYDTVISYLVSLSVDLLSSNAKMRKRIQQLEELVKNK